MTVYVNRRGKNIWHPGQEAPSISPSRNPGESFKGTVACTARMIGYLEKGILTQEEYEAGLEKNAASLQISTEELVEKAVSLIQESTEIDSSNAEKLG